MNARSRSYRPLARLALVAVLLLAQGLLLAHEVDHLGTAESGLCAVCQVGHGLDSPVVASSGPPPVACGEFAPFAPLAGEQADGLLRSHQARAPPHALSY